MHVAGCACSEWCYRRRMLGRCRVTMSSSTRTAARSASHSAHSSQQAACGKAAAVVYRNHLNSSHSHRVVWGFPTSLSYSLLGLFPRPSAAEHSCRGPLAHTAGDSGTLIISSVVHLAQLIVTCTHQLHQPPTASTTSCTSQFA